MPLTAPARVTRHGSPGTGAPAPGQTGVGSAECESNSTGDTSPISVVVCAYNEEQNIGNLLGALLAESVAAGGPTEVVCVASGCTDRTVEIVRGLQSVDSRLHLLIQPERQGKANALALGLSRARGELIVVQNADTLPSSGFLREITKPFADPAVQLVCSHPVPAPNQSTLAGRLSRTMWTVHDEVCAVSPNAGEAYALRAPPPRIPDDVLDDDAFVSAETKRLGGRVVYARRAIVYNNGPRRVSEYIRQRFRIHRQAAALHRRTGSWTSTKSPAYAAPAFARVLRAHRVRLVDLAVFGAVEVSLVGLARSRLFDGRDLQSWTPIESTKLPVGRQQ